MSLAALGWRTWSATRASSADTSRRACLAAARSPSSPACPTPAWTSSPASAPRAIIRSDVHQLLLAVWMVLHVYRTGDTRSRDIVEAFGSTVFGVLSLALLALDLVTFAAQERPPAGQSVPLYRGGVEVVNVAATVWDASGEPVTDLSADDFEIYERGRRQPVQVFQRIAIPILREAEELLLARDSPDVASNAFPTRHAPS